jgi:hypothetical protein
MVFQKIAVILGIISLIGFFASTGNQRKISGALLALSIFLGIVTFSGYNSSPLNPTPTEQSARQQEQAGSSSPTPTPEAPIARERIAQIPGKVIVLTKSKTITLPPGQKDICFSWLGDSTGYWNQSLEIGNQTYTTQGSDCFPVTQEGSVEVKFINPPQTEVDTYQFAKNQKEGQGEYPFIKLTK